MLDSTFWSRRLCKNVPKNPRYLVWNLWKILKQTKIFDQAFKKTLVDIKHFVNISKNLWPWKKQLFNKIHHFSVEDHLKNFLENLQFLDKMFLVRRSMNKIWIVVGRLLIQKNIIYNLPKQHFLKIHDFWSGCP